MPTPYRYLRRGDWRSEIARGHGPAQRFIHSDDDDDDDDDDGDVKLDTTTQQEGV